MNLPETLPPRESEPPGETSEPECRPERGLLRIGALWLGVLLAIEFVLVPLVLGSAGDPLYRLQARMVALAANLVGIPTTSQGNHVATPEYFIEMGKSCLGLDRLLFLFALVMLFPRPVVGRGLFAVGLPLALFLITVSRLALTLGTGTFGTFERADTLVATGWIFDGLAFLALWGIFVGIQLNWRGRIDPAGGA